MNDLIRISDDGKVTARELYEFLQLDSTHFIRWFKNNIIDNQFAAEGTDYKVFAINGENPKGGRPGQDADLSIDFAKKLCMVSKSERGEQARNYFIEVEKRFKAAQPPQLPKLRTRRPAGPRIKSHVKDAYEAAKFISDKFGVNIGIAMAAGLNAVERNFGVDLAPIAKCLPSAKHSIGYLNATGIGKKLGGISARAVNLKLAGLGLQRKEGKDWRLTDIGRQYGEVFPFDAKSGHSDYQIRWSESVLSLLTYESSVITQ